MTHLPLEAERSIMGNISIIILLFVGVFADQSVSGFIMMIPPTAAMRNSLMIGTIPSPSQVSSSSLFQIRASMDDDEEELVKVPRRRRRGRLFEDEEEENAFYDQVEERLYEDRDDEEWDDEEDEYDDDDDDDDEEYGLFSDVLIDNPLLDSIDPDGSAERFPELAADPRFWIDIILFLAFLNFLSAVGPQDYFPDLPWYPDGVQIGTAAGGM